MNVTTALTGDAPPTVALTAPTSGATVSSPISIIATASADVGVTKVKNLAPKPGIALRGGRFVYTDSGQDFHAVGFNYIQLNGAKLDFNHTTFSPGVYNPARVEAALAPR